MDSSKATEIVGEYIEEHLDKSDGKIDLDVYIVWQCYILGNAKWLISSTLPDGMYYELTWDSKTNKPTLTHTRSLRTGQFMWIDNIIERLN